MRGSIWRCPMSRWSAAPGWRRPKRSPPATGPASPSAPVAPQAETTVRRSCMMSSANLARSEKALSLGITAEEWALRVELAACYRIFDLLGWTEFIFNHITLRVTGPERHFLINPFGLWYSEVTASNLVKIDLDGNTIGKSEWPVNKAGFIIHGAIHAARPDAHCIMHTHTIAGMTLAASDLPVRAIDFAGAALHERVAYHGFSGVHSDMSDRES